MNKERMLKLSQDFTRNILIHLRVVHALILRETRTRFGKYQIGFLWAFLEPIIWISTFIILFIYTNRHIPDQMSLFSFLLTGLLPFSLFRSALSKISLSLDANKSLLYYPPVKVIDIICARAYLEIFINLFVMIILLCFEHIYIEPVIIEEPLGVLFGIFLLWIFSVGLGMVFLNLISLIPSFEKIVPIIQRPLFFTSGLFFTAHELNPTIREIFLFNPLLHFIEIIRYYFFIEYDIVYFSYGYIFIWLSFFYLVSLVMLKRTRGRLQFS